MPKISTTTLVAVVLAAALGYLAFNPDAARPAVNWLRGQVGSAPDTRGVAPIGYTPVIPGR